MSELISVVIPVYNVEAFLARCLDSVLSQSYGELEIILVDDGATDGSGAICDDYAGRDKRVRVLHKANGGLSSARNAGLDAATGEYIAFVDSDDVMHPQMCELLLAALKKTGAGMAVGGIWPFSGAVADFPPPESPQAPPQVYAGPDFMRQLLYSFHVLGVVSWNKLYARRDFGGIRFPEGRWHEDEFTTYKLVHRAKSIAYVQQPLYGYFQRPDSIMGRKYSAKRLDVLDAYDERCRFFLEEGYEALYPAAMAKYLANIADAYASARAAGLDGELLAGLRRRFTVEFDKNRKLLPVKKRTLLAVFQLSPAVFRLVPAGLRLRL